MMDMQKKAQQLKVDCRCLRGPRGILYTEALENGLEIKLRGVHKLGRPGDGTIGRWHWENWSYRRRSSC